MGVVEINLLGEYDRWYEYDVYIRGGSFAGKASFSITFDEYEVLLNTLEKMYKSLCGEAIISDSDTDDFVHITMLKYGHIKIESQLGRSWKDNWVKLSFESDQGLLRSIIQQFKSFSNNNTVN